MLIKFLLTLVASLLMCLSTGVGSLFVFLIKDNNKKLNLFLINFALGVMFASCFISLLYPVLNFEKINIFYIIIAFILGIAVNLLINYISLKLLKRNNSIASFETSMIVHNALDGLVVGMNIACNNLFTAILFSISMIIQNIPEGFSVSMSAYSKLKNKIRSFVLGFLSGIIEPFLAFIGLYIGFKLNNYIAYLLMFSFSLFFFNLLEFNERKNNIYENIYISLGFLFMLIIELIF